MAHWHRLAASVLVLGSVGAVVPAAHAQTVSLPPSAAIECMTPPVAARGKPVYPPEMLQRKEGGTIRVELVFTGPDAAPETRLLDKRDSYSGLVDAIREHVSSLRVPCMTPDSGPVRISQTFVFRPDDGRDVVSLPARDLGDEARERTRECLTRITPEVQPEYPTGALRDDAEGRFLVRLRFPSPSAPPEVKFVAGPDHRSLRKAITDFTPGYRLPCQSGAPVELDIVFVFHIDGGARTVLRDMPLKTFLRAARSLPPARFDFGAMGCPFDLRVSYFQPFKPSKVGQLDTAREERLDFMAWLRGIELKVDEDTALDLMGDTFTLSVPCGTLDL